MAAMALIVDVEDHGGCRSTQLPSVQTAFLWRQENLKPTDATGFGRKPTEIEILCEKLEYAWIIARTTSTWLMFQFEFRQLKWGSDCSNLYQALFCDWHAPCTAANQDARCRSALDSKGSLQAAWDLQYLYETLGHKVTWQPQTQGCSTDINENHIVTDPQHSQGLPSR
jgi:hypothetical protein